MWRPQHPAASVDPPLPGPTGRREQFRHLSKIGFTSTDMHEVAAATVSVSASSESYCADFDLTGWVVSVSLDMKTREPTRITLDKLAPGDDGEIISCHLAAHPDASEFKPLVDRARQEVSHAVSTSMVDGMVYQDRR